MIPVKLSGGQKVRLAAGAAQQQRADMPPCRLHVAAGLEVSLVALAVAQQVAAGETRARRRRPTGALGVVVAQAFLLQERLLGEATRAKHPVGATGTKAAEEATCATCATAETVPVRAADAAAATACAAAEAVMKKRRQQQGAQSPVAAHVGDHGASNQICSTREAGCIAVGLALGPCGCVQGHPG